MWPLMLPIANMLDRKLNGDGLITGGGREGLSG
jgi:hypothetical protein